MHPNPTRSFFMRLERIPSLRSLPPFLKDRQIRLFLVENADRLRALFASAKWLPGVPWGEIERELAQLSRKSLSVAVSNAYTAIAHALPYIPGATRDEITGLGGEERSTLASLGISAFSSDGADIADGDSDDDASDGEAIDDDDARELFLGDFNALAFDTWSRYIDKAFERRGYLYDELAARDGLSLDAERAKILVRLALLLRPRFFRDYLARRRNGAAKLVEPDESLRGEMLAAIAEKAPFAGELAARCCVESSLDAEGEAKPLSAARLARILALRHRFAPSGESVAAALKAGRAGRGAESADASFYSWAAPEARRFGLDPAMLEELRGYAAEEGW